MSEGRTALLLMSHNYERDLNFLYHWIERKEPVDYIGILGPKTRKEQMVLDLVERHRLPNEKIPMEILHGPIGDKSYGRSSQAIALSIVSELQKQFFGETKKEFREEINRAVVREFSN